MPAKHIRPLLLTVFALLHFAVLADWSRAADAPAPPLRTGEMTYTARVHGIPLTAKTVGIWLPYPHSDEHQIIRDVRVTSPFPCKVAREQEYHNEILHLIAQRPQVASIEVQMRFVVTRKENTHPGAAKCTARSVGSVDPSLQRYLEPDQLVPADAEIKLLAERITAGQETVAGRARALYDYVRNHMVYSKEGVGWGRGDSRCAFKRGRGNCTDFHSLFICLARAVGIPARFAIGFPLPPQKEGNIGGYHCWAEFHLPSEGWVPVDISEAGKHPEKANYFFGSLDVNRVQFTVGRDLRLVPAQKGDPLNFFVYPYVEVDGKPFDKVDKTFAFRETPPATSAGAAGNLK